MHKKLNWLLLAATVVATAIATLAVLEYLHRHPDCRLARWWHGSQGTAARSDATTPRLQIHSFRGSDPSSAPTPGPESDFSIPPDILQQSLRELRLLDRFAAGAAKPGTPVTGTADVDEFCPEKIPVPPRCVLADTRMPEQRVTIPDGRTLAPVASVEVLSVAPKPVLQEAVPEDLDCQTDGQTEPVCDTPEQPEKAAPADEEVPSTQQGNCTPTGKFFTGVVAVVGVINCPRGIEVEMVSGMRSRLAELVGWLCGIGESPAGYCRPLCPKSGSPTEGAGSCCRHVQTEKQTHAQTDDSSTDASPQPSEAGHTSNAGKSGRECTQRLCQRSPQSNFIARVYPVVDLIESVADGEEIEYMVAKLLDCESFGKNDSLSPSPRRSESECSYRQRGWVRYHNGSCSLVVVETCENHTRVAELLGGMRKAAQVKREFERVHQHQDEPETKPELPWAVGETERVIVVPIVRPVFVPVAVPIPVGVPATELPPPQFRVPDTGSTDEECPARRFAPPATPEQLPDCQDIPAEILPVLRRILEQLRGAVPDVIPERPFSPGKCTCPGTLPVFPPDEEDTDDECPRDDDEDLQPLETDLSPPIG